MASKSKTDPIVLNLANPESITVDKDGEYYDGGKGFENYKKLLLPARTNLFGPASDDDQPIIVGEIPLVSDPAGMKGKISIESKGPDLESAGLLEGFLDRIEMTFDAEAVNALFPDKTIRVFMKSDLLAGVEDPDEGMQPKGFEIEKEEEPVEVLCSRTVHFEDEDGSPDSMEFFILPDTYDGDLIFPSTVEQEGGSRWSFTSELHSEQTSEASEFFEAETKLTFRIFRRNKLKKEVRKFIKSFGIKHPEHDTGSDAFIDLAIQALKKNSTIIPYIHQSYSIGIYNSAVQNFVEADAAHPINPSLRTLILVPGTFKKSVERTMLTDGSVVWDGSFKYLMEPTGGQANWFEYLFKETDFRQVISFEHDSTIESLDDNIRFFISHLSAGKIKFEHPAAIISASRGGFLAKKMAWIGADQDATFRSAEFNLNINKIITVANGFTGYLAPANRDTMKRKMEFLLSILKIGNLRLRGQSAWLLSFAPDFILRLPGLLQQSRDSVEIKPMLAKQIPGLWCYPLANNHTTKFPKFIEKFVDSVLGPDNDFVLSFDSQKEYFPGNLMDKYGPLIGTRMHGKGLCDEPVRLKITEFLKEEAPAATPVADPATDPVVVGP